MSANGGAASSAISEFDQHKKVLRHYGPAGEMYQERERHLVQKTDWTEEETVLLMRRFWGMKDNRSAFFTKKDGEKTHLRFAFIDSAVPLGVGLHEGLSGMVVKTVAILKLYGQLTFQNVDVAWHRVGHPVGFSSGGKGEDDGRHFRSRRGEITDRLTYIGCSISGDHGDDFLMVRLWHRRSLKEHGRSSSSTELI